MGSSITYMRRYNLSAIVGISTDEDDDGEKAMNRNGNSKEEKPKKDAKQEKDAVISKEEMKVLTELADQCDPKYLEKVHDHLHSMGYDGYGAITTKIYPQVVNGMRKNADMVRAKNG
jgi:hypothetical protein